MSTRQRRSARLAAAVSSALALPFCVTGSLVAGLALVAPAHAQETTTQITGVVQSADGGVVPGARVTITHEPTGSSRSFTTNAEGRFFASGLRPGGPYRVVAEGDGFEPTALESIFTQLGQPAAVNLALRATEALADIVVTGAREQQMGVTARFDADQILNSPTINRDLKDVIRVDPTVNLDPANAFAISIAGQNVRYNSLTVDGIRQNDDFGLNSSGYATNRTPVSLDAVEQLSVLTAPWDAQYSGFQGGNINVVTRSGTNRFSGSAFYFYGDDGFAGDRSRNQTINLQYEEKTWGATLGGPILQDRLFFFLSYEQFERTAPTAFGPAGSGYPNVVPQVTQANYDQIRQIAQQVYNYDPLAFSPTVPEEAERILVNLDWNITDNHRARLSYQRTEDFDTAGQTTSAAQRRIAAPSQWYERGYKMDQYVAQIFSNWTDVFSTELRIGRKEVANRQEPRGGLSFPEMRILNIGGTGTAGGEVYLGPDFSRHANSLANDQNQARFRAEYLLGNHTLSAGLEWEQVDVFNIFLQNALGVYTFNSIADFQARQAQSLTYSNALTNVAADAAATFKYDTTSLYLQDRWQVTPTFLVNLGVRYERISSDDQPRLNAGYVARYGFQNNLTYDGRELWLPRFGFDWNVTDRTTVSGGIGLFGGGTPNVWLSNSYSNDGVIQATQTFARTGTLTPLQQAALDNVTGQIPQAVLNAQTQLAGRGTVNAIDPNFKLPSSYRYVLGVRHNADLWRLGDRWDIGAELQYTDVRNAPLWISQRQVQVGTAPDGRPLYGYRPTDPTTAPGRGTDTYDLLLTNTKQGSALVFKFDIGKAWDTRAGLFDTYLGYAFMDAEDVTSATSSVALSNWDNLATADINNPGVATSNYEIRHRFPLRLSWRKAFFGENETAVNLFVERRSGRPYSYTFAGTSAVFGDPRQGTRQRQLFYVPRDQNDVILEGGLTWAALDAFIVSQGLDRYRGEIAPRNAFRSPWVTTADLQFRQELPGFIRDHKAVVTLDILNVANLINRDWGRFEQVNFPFVVPVVQAAGIDAATNRYRYSGTVPTGRSLSINPPEQSVWRLQLGLRYQF